MHSCHTRTRFTVSYLLAGIAAGFVFAGAALAEGQPELVVNPYANVDWETCQQYKANLHTHTTQSDGRVEPADAIAKYREQGYDILALTDHNLCTWPWSKYDPDGSHEGMLAIPGNELSRHHHAQSLFCPLETESRDLEKSIEEVKAAGGLSIINHPVYHWGREIDTASAIQVKLVPALRKITQSDFTVEAWFCTTSSGRNILMGNYKKGTKGHLNLELHTKNHVRVFVSGKKVTDLNVSASELGIDTRDGKWHHLAGTRQGETVTIYLDGQVAGVKIDKAGAYDLSGDIYFIARDTRGGKLSFEGNLNRVRLWNRALSPEEIGSLFKGKLPGQKKGPVTEGLLAQYKFEEKPEELIPEEIIQRYEKWMRTYPHLLGMEVLNGTQPLPAYYLDRVLWDALLTRLMPSRPVWGFASDDMHHLRYVGRDWISVLSPSLEEKPVRKAITDGTFFFSSIRVHEDKDGLVEATPVIKKIAHDPASGTITITATESGKPLAEDAYHWIADGKLVHVGPTLNYRTTSNIGSYVRAELCGQGGITMTNPFGFSPEK